jgi:YHS domain-containing protein
MRRFGLTVAVFAMSFILSSIAFVQSGSQKPAPQATKKSVAKQQVRCPVSGKVITNTKQAPKYTYRGKTYYFSCRNCLAEFKKNPEKYVKRADRRAPSNAAAKGACNCSCKGTERCCTRGNPDGKCCCNENKETACSSEEKQAGGCCNGQKGAQPAFAERVAAPADKLICPVSGEELTETDAVRFTYNGKVYYTCCNGCKSKFLRDPETYAKKAEEISKLQGKPENENTDSDS